MERVYRTLVHTVVRTEALFHHTLCLYAAHGVRAGWHGTQLAARQRRNPAAVAARSGSDRGDARRQTCTVSSVFVY